MLFVPKRTLTFFVHSFGMFFGIEPVSQRFIAINPAEEIMRFYVENEIYQVLSSNEAPCNEDLAYDQDACIKDQLHKVNFRLDFERN